MREDEWIEGRREDEWIEGRREDSTGTTNIDIELRA